MFILKKPVFVTQCTYALSGLLFINKVLFDTLREIITIHIPNLYGRERCVPETYTRTHTTQTNCVKVASSIFP
jgi:hypothetical protein